MRAYTILIIDDDSTIHSALSPVLDDAGYKHLHACDGIEGITLDLKDHPDLVIVDLQMPRIDGIETVTRLHGQSPDTPILMLTAHGSFQSAVAAVKAGAFDFLGKPFDNDHLLLVIERGLEHRRLSRELLELRKKDRNLWRTEQILGESPVMHELRARIRRAAPTNASVLLEGESGSGKELAARALHAESDRASGPFVAVNCAAIPRPLAESEFFGHEKGAFTDAHEMRQGKFEEADHGTIFLDEIAELPPEIQAKLLRVLQERQVIRVGSNAPVRIDVRVVAATNRDLQHLVAEKRFREDLFYRLNVLPIRIPPLREHKEDIPLYAGQILARSRAVLSVTVESISEKTLFRLEQHDWPGNIRELENVLQRSLLFASGNVLEEEDLDFGAQRARGYDPSEGLENHVLAVCREAERSLILDALRRFGSNRAHAAEYLRIARSTLYRKLDEHGIHREGPFDE
jgi:two-component system, NtrC family, response regulator HydG